MFSVIKNLFIQGNICESKRKINFCNKFSMQVNLLVEFYREKYNLYKYNKTIT